MITKNKKTVNKLANNIKCQIYKYKNNNKREKPI